MNEIVSSQALLFMTSVEIGIIMGIIFDLIRIFRKIIKHPNFLVQIEDLLFWMMCGLVAFYLLYINNYAAIRPFAFLGMLLGAIFYFASFSLLFMKVATLIIDYVRACIKYLWHLFLIPLKGLVTMIKKPLRYIKEQYKQFEEEKNRKARIVRRVRYQEKSDQLTEKKVQAQFKKINLEKKRQAKLLEKETEAQAEKRKER